ncbi:MAG: substrate-binding periplasmic protein [Cellvibrionaceae bacterium]
MRSAIVFALICCLVSCTEPESEAPAVIDSGERSIEKPQPQQPTLDICATEWMPFSYIIADKPTGIMIELAQNIAKSLGYKARFHFMAPQRCYSETHQGHMDLSLFMSPLALSRPETQLRAIKPSVQNQMPVLVVKQENPLQQFSSLSEMSGRTIAGIRGNSFMLKNQDAGPEWIPANQLDYLWQLLMSERVDAALGDFHSRVMLTPEQQQTVRFVLPPMEIEPIYWAGHQSKPTLIQQFSDELEIRLSNGEVDRFYLRHLGTRFSDLRQMIESGQYEQQEHLRTSEQVTPN